LPSPIFCPGNRSRRCRAEGVANKKIDLPENVTLVFDDDHISSISIYVDYTPLL
jgi:hypothetical protein